MSIIDVSNLVQNDIKYRAEFGDKVDTSTGDKIRDSLWNVYKEHLDLVMKIRAVVMEYDMATYNEESSRE